MIAFFTIALLHLLAVVSPGPDFVLVTRNALTYPRSTALWTALGIGCGIWIHVIFCIVGIGLIIASSPLLFNSIKVLGACYLLYIGTSALLAKRHASQQDRVCTKTHPTAPAAFNQGLICNILNPKATLFFLSLFTLVVTPETSILIQILYGLEMSVVTFLWFGGLSILFTQSKISHSIRKFQYIISKAMGGILIAFGMYLIITTF